MVKQTRYMNAGIKSFVRSHGTGNMVLRCLFALILLLAGVLPDRYFFDSFLVSVQISIIARLCVFILSAGLVFEYDCRMHRANRFFFRSLGLDLSDTTGYLACGGVIVWGIVVCVNALLYKRSVRIWVILILFVFLTLITYAAVLRCDTRRRYGNRSGRKTSQCTRIYNTNNPLLELASLYASLSYTAEKIIAKCILYPLLVIVFLKYDNRLFLFCATAVAFYFLTLCNDSYWMKESAGFRYIRASGIGLYNYLLIHSATIMIVDGWFMLVLLLIKMLPLYYAVLFVVILAIAVLYVNTMYIFVLNRFDQHRQGGRLFAGFILSLLGLIPIVNLLCMFLMQFSIKKEWQ